MYAIILVVINMDISLIGGVGDKLLDYLNKLKLYTVEDLLEYYPYRYEIIKVIKMSEVKPLTLCTIKGVVESEPHVTYINKKFNKMTFRLNADGYLVNVTIFNRGFYKNNLKIGRVVNVIGKYDNVRNSFTASDIKFELITGVKVLPVYHLVSGLNNKVLTKIINDSFSLRVDLEDDIPSYLKEKYNFMDKKEALYNIHFPHSTEALKKARLRCIYEEFFVFMFKMNYLKYQYDLNNVGVSRKVDYLEVSKFIDTLPFQLTDDQLATVRDIYNDLISHKRMNRLVLGDVGSGKTCVAEIGMYINYMAGYQSSMMAPTEILARQHYEGIKNIFAKTNIKVSLLVGSMKKSEKKKIYAEIQNGEVDILVGTHALISEEVHFKNLGLVITDEQHRFGVNQRGLLQNKGILSDVLYLSATPIPRTYALTLYGDMDTSIIKQKPNGRKEIITKVVNVKNLKQVLFHMLEEVKAGHQIYVVAPLIEDEDGNSDLIDVLKLKEKFDIAFNNKVKTAILHGKKKNSEKDDVMNRFKNGDIKILISTTVIEVGVDVKNSTMIVIFNAERFGLATLHQLRGRVGRNDLQSYCYLISDASAPRLKVMEESNDGFYISQKDFELRGEGDLFGTKQSGDMIFKIGDIKRDFKILVQCKNDANIFVEKNTVNNFKDYPQYLKILKELEFLD